MMRFTDRWPKARSLVVLLLLSLAVLSGCLIGAKVSLADCAAERSRDGMCGMGAVMLRLFGYMAAGTILLIGGVRIFFSRTT